MSEFIQLHILTSYPPSNLNRDDTGRPKTANFGGRERLRISSQSLKRAWRTSPIFEESLGEFKGTRTKRIGPQIFNSLREKFDLKTSYEISLKIAGQFGKVKEFEKKDTSPLKEETKENIAKIEKALETEQLVHFAPEEWSNIFTLVEKLKQDVREPKEEELALLRAKTHAADIALFGRMLASSPKFNQEAAVQVAHAISVSSVTVEDDFFTAVDDLNDGKEEAGAAHIDELGFASGVFYLYVCINRDLLKENLSGDEELTKRTISALVECAAKISPSGKQNSFAARPYASYILAERGTQQPRTLASAFLKSVEGDDDHRELAIKRLEAERESIDAAYGACAEEVYPFSVFNKAKDFGGLIEFVRGARA